MQNDQVAIGGKPNDVLQRVATLARNLWWTWNSEPQRLFAALDPVEWEASNHNPLLTLGRLTPERRAALADDAAFCQHLVHCEAELKRYLGARTWFERTATPRQKRMRVAYFCAEFGLHECLPQYAGGLGVLAGDHLKSASDLGVPLTAVGLLYRCGYYRQSFGRDGATRAAYPRHDFDMLPIGDTGKRISVPLADRRVRVRIWLVQVGRVPLYMLDTDLPGNPPRDRAITRSLYGGDRTTRICQEILLGVGGVLALERLGVRPTVYHLNEGHAAFCGLERLRQLRKSGKSLASAIKRVRASTVFTTHTPVPAGHDRFEPKPAVRHLKPISEDLGLSQHDFLALGREDPAADGTPLCMTALALRLSERCNGVSKLHGEVSREMWMHVYGAKRPADVPIGHVTNGVHSQTWMAPEIEPLYRRYLKPRWLGAGPDDKAWARIGDVPPAELWRIRGVLRSRLVHFIRQRLRQQIQRRLGPTEELIAACETFDESALTIGFARRFATYKRAPLIFHDADRLATLLNKPGRPVQLVFAGKAHPRDAAGQAFAQRVYRRARQAGFCGRVVLLEDYDMCVGRMLTSGCDVWLNNPLRPQEASGTSGMKPPLHGGLNCSILDGWWPEVCDGRNGWAIEADAAERGQDRRDAEALYRLLEEEIVPLFYERDRGGLPRAWVRRMLRSMRTVCSVFNTHRMVGDYVRGYYLPSHG